MIKEHKELLLQDLCARIPYGVKCVFGVDDATYEICGINPTCCGASEIQATHIKSGINGDFTLNSLKPYLFPLSSMTEEQKMFLRQQNWCIAISTSGTIETTIEGFDWLNKNHFDYRGLISMSLAIDATGLNVY